ncbi:MAG: tetratricopeptide repeat protein [Desulfovibrio sp.]|nr:tetratricopeptide repeat protein [Desulfovibrio sp.]
MAEDGIKTGLARRMEIRQTASVMSKALADNKSQDKLYNEIVTGFLRDKGRIIYVSDDSSLSEKLRETVCTRLKMPAGCLSSSATADTLLASIRQAVTAGDRPLLIIEQCLRGRDMTYLLRLLRNGFPEILVIMIVRETSKQRFTLLHESGVDNCIVKPVATQALLEKIALTVKPQGKIGRQLEWARNLMTQGDYLQALQVCRQALEIRANSSATLMLIGDIFRAMKQYDKACEAYENASRVSSVFIEPLSKLADLHAASGNLPKQLEYLHKLDEISPLNLERKLLIGELYFKLNRPDKARKTFEEVMELSDREAREHVAGVAFRVAEVYTEHDPKTAAAFLQRGLEAKKSFWDIEDIITFNRLGLLLRRAGKWAEAVEEYRKAIHVAPNDESLHYNLAMAYLEGGEYESARSSALKTLGLKPEFPSRSAAVACNLATIFLRTGDKVHALPLLRQALERDPEHEQARALLQEAGGEEGGG